MHIRGKRYVPVAPEIVDSAEEGWAFVCFQPLAHWNGEGLLLPLTPRCLPSILKAKVPSAVGLLPMEAGCPQDARASEDSRDELQAGGTGWVRAIWVAARQGRGRGCVILLLHMGPFVKGGGNLEKRGDTSWRIVRARCGRKSGVNSTET